MLVTVQTIVDSAIDLADMRNSAFIDQSGTVGTELIRYANMAYKDLYQRIVLSKEFYFTTSTNISVVNGTSSYALPSDFYKLDGVDMAIDSSGRYLTLQPFGFVERNKFRSGLNVPIAPYGQIFRYIIVGSTIQFVPIPSLSCTVQMWYTPEPITVTLSSSLQLPIGGDEYMSLYIACAMLAKEETDSTSLNQKRLEIIDQLKLSLKDRDQGSPHKIVDVTSINAGALWPIRGTY